jgi:hypothetical protein
VAWVFSFNFSGDKTCCGKTWRCTDAFCATGLFPVRFVVGREAQAVAPVAQSALDKKPPLQLFSPACTEENRLLNTEHNGRQAPVKRSLARLAAVRPQLHSGDAMNCAFTKN